MDNFKRNFSEILIIAYMPVFKLYLKVDFINKNDFFIINAKKLKLKSESTTSNLEEAKEEFADLVISTLKLLIKDGSLFNVFEYLGIKQEPEIKIIRDFKLQSNNKNKVEFSISNLFKNNIESTNNIIPNIVWNNNNISLGI